MSVTAHPDRQLRVHQLTIRGAGFWEAMLSLSSKESGFENEACGQCAERESDNLLRSEPTRTFRGQTPSGTKGSPRISRLGDSS